ncbi:hypothetical protein GCM10009646_37840 [Streptomyces aureus]
MFCKGVRNRTAMRPAPPSGPRRPGPAPPAPGGAGRRGTTRTRRGPPSPEPLASPRHESLTTSVIKRTPGVNTRKEICQLCDIYDGARPARTDALRRTQRHGEAHCPRGGTGSRNYTASYAIP